MFKPSDTKKRAQEYYNEGSRILENLNQASYRDRGLEEASRRTHEAILSLPKNLRKPAEISKYLRKHSGKVSSSIPKDLEKAIKHLQKATKLDPSFAHAFHNLA
ncbi:MAG: tetratricopeptide repeat protein, partial [Dehalococcoidales bacterium]|nr:tetratricopeptide repeat protein [Dehalococcoidales bacterium]